MHDKTAYGYVNGKPVYSRDEFIFESRSSRYKDYTDVNLKEQITNNTELLKFAEKVTYGWQRHGHRQKFTHYFLTTSEEPYNSLTLDEFNRLKQIQEEKYAEWKAEEARYEYDQYSGKKLEDDIIMMFLNKRIKDAEETWGPDSERVRDAEDRKSRILRELDEGKVVAIDSYQYNATYGNGTGTYERILYSDGTIKEGCYGYLD